MLLGLTVPDLDDPHLKPRASYLVVIDPDDPDAAAVLRRFDGRLPPAAWDRTGNRIVVIDHRDDQTGGDVVILDPATGSTTTLPDAIPPDHSVLYIR